MRDPRRPELPLYDYECHSCGHVYELRQSFDAEPLGVCPICEGRTKRRFHAVPIIYKGSGFYTTDYKHTSYSGTSTNGKEEEGAEGAKEKKEAVKPASDHAEDKKEPKKEAVKEA